MCFSSVLGRRIKCKLRPRNLVASCLYTCFNCLGVYFPLSLSLSLSLPLPLDPLLSSFPFTPPSFPLSLLFFQFSFLPSVLLSCPYFLSFFFIFLLWMAMPFGLGLYYHPKYFIVFLFLLIKNMIQVGYIYFQENVGSYICCSIKILYETGKNHRKVIVANQSTRE